MRAPHRLRFMTHVGCVSPAAAALVSLLALDMRSSAQDGDTELVQRTAAAIAVSVSANSQCSIELRGAPRFDGLANAWLVAYMAAGSSCDAAADELRRLGKESAL